MVKPRYPQRESLLRLETGTIIKSGAPLRVCLVFPNRYSVAMSNLGFQTIYRELNGRFDTWCERGVLDPALGYESIETGTPFARFDVLAFSVSFELDFVGLARVLVESGVPLLSSERDTFDPLVVLGGVCATSNPEPVADFIDVVVIGEGENVVHELVETVLGARGQERTELLQALAANPAFYVPCFSRAEYRDDRTIETVGPRGPRTVAGSTPTQGELGTPAFSQVVTPRAQFPNTFLIEVSRGCARHCQFCLVRALYPYRVWRVKQLKEIIEEHCPRHAKVGLVGAAVSDHPDIDELATWLVDSGKKISVSSLRVDSTSETLLRALVASGQRTVTFAPEVGTDRMAAAIKKGITREVLLDRTAVALKVGLKNIRLYFMVGLPSERDGDVDAIVALTRSVRDIVADRTKGRGRVTVSVNPFVPKPLTPLERVPMERRDVLERRIKLIASSFSERPDVRLKCESVRLAVLQGILSRGDRRLGRLIELMAREDMSFGRALRRSKLDPEFYLYRERTPEEILPWQLPRM